MSEEEREEREEREVPGYGPLPGDAIGEIGVQVVCREITKPGSRHDGKRLVQMNIVRAGKDEMDYILLLPETAEQVAAILSATAKFCRGEKSIAEFARVLPPAGPF